MIEGFLRVAVATPKIKVADVRFNTEAVLREIVEADRQGVSLLVFPELVLTAYTCADLFHQTILIERAAVKICNQALDNAGGMAGAAADNNNFKSFHF